MCQSTGPRVVAGSDRASRRTGEQNDVEFFSDMPENWLSLPAGHFAIFFPDDAHAPLAGRGALTKAVMKIAVG